MVRNIGRTLILIIGLLSISGITYIYSAPTSHSFVLYGSSSTEEARTITSDSTYLYISGMADNSDTSYDVLVVKLDPSTNQVSWADEIQGSDSDVAQGSTTGSDGYLYLTGYTSSNSAGLDDIFIAKINPSTGALEWFKTINGAQEDMGYSICQSPNDGYLYATGYTESFGAGGYDAFIVKIDTSGSLAGFYTIGGSYNDYGYGIACDSSGGIYVTGRTDSYGVGSGDMFIAKFDSTQQRLNWFTTIGSTDSSYTDYGWSVVYGDDGYIYASGIFGYESNGANISVAKIDATTGSVVWFKVIGGDEDDDQGYGITYAPDGKLYLTGYTTSYGSGDEDVFIAMVEPSDGSIGWFKTTGGSDYDRGYSVIVGPGNYLYVAGRTNSYGEGSYDLFSLMASDALGNLTWTGGEDWDQVHVYNVALDSNTPSYSSSNPTAELNSYLDLTTTDQSFTVLDVSNSLTEHVAQDSSTPDPVPEPWLLSFMVLGILGILVLYRSG